MYISEIVSTLSTAVILTSSIGGVAACPGEEVVFTCRTTEAATLIWSSDQFSNEQQEISFLLMSPQNTQVVDGNFTATLTEVNVTNIVSLAYFTSTLAVTATVELNGTVIKCTTVPQEVTENLLVAGWYRPLLQ